MRITTIEAMRLVVPPEITRRFAEAARVKARRPGWYEEAEVANPMSRYPKVKRHRSLWTPRWEAVWCKVTAEDGTWGLGNTGHGRPVAAMIEDHLAPQLVGEDALAGEKLADMMFRLTKPYGSTGLASYAISAVDLALWDLRGKLLGQPVYALLGGPQKDRIFCYCTGNDIDWYQELGFRAFKLACPYGPADGLDGLRKNEAFVAKAREQIGDDVRADARLLDGVRRGIHGAAGRDAAPVSPQVDRGVPDPGGFRRARRAAPTPAVADACDRRALVHARPVPVGRQPPRRRHPPAGHQLVRRTQHVQQDRGRGQ